MNKFPDWLVPVYLGIQRTPDSQCLLVDIPVYRPDLAKGMSATFGLAYHDFRAEYLKGKGPAADSVPLTEMDDWLVHQVADGGMVFHNVEALLACYGEQERSEWLNSLIAREWPNRLLVPLYLFGGLVDEESPARVALEYTDLPEQGLIGRMLNS